MQRVLLKNCSKWLSVGLLASSLGVAAELKFAPGEGEFSWQSLDAFKQYDFSGKKVTVFGPFLSPESDYLETVLDYFEQATGATVEYIGSHSFEEQIVLNVEAGNPPNIAAFPQPGLAADLAKQGYLSVLPDSIKQVIQQDFAAGESWLDLGSYRGADDQQAFYGLPYKADVKSLVWYNPKAFAKAGYTPPTTMEELVALSDKIVADGNKPWCIGLASGIATGWPATDWVEDILLRTQSVEVYDAWVNNEIPFNDARIVEALNTFGSFAKNNAYVAGGVDSVETTDFRESPKGLFGEQPQCYMHRQASFIAANFPQGVVMGEDADFFYFPSYSSKDLGNPLLGGGILYAITQDSEPTRKLMEFLATPLAHELWMAQGAFLSPHKKANPQVYVNNIIRRQGEIMLKATTFRFDGSDLMPSAVGAGTFWSGMVDFVGGSSAEDVTQSIQESWDELK